MNATPASSGPNLGLILALTVNGLAVSAYPDMVTVAKTAEDYGFDSVWLCDHFLTINPDDYVKDAGITPDGEGGQPVPPRSLPLLEGWTALTALARDTTRLRLGTSVLCNSYRHPSRDVSIWAWAPAGLSANSTHTGFHSRRYATESPHLPNPLR
jgi:hypothetical protein